MKEILAYVSHFKRLYGQLFQPVAAQLGLSQLEIDILLFLHNNPAYNTARDIVAMRGVAKSNVSTAVDALKRKGCLLSEADPDSRKVQRLSLPASMDEPLRALAAVQQQCFSFMLEGFSPEERGTLRQFLERIDANVVAALQKKNPVETEA